jgi:hypothetical protein
MSSTPSNMTGALMRIREQPDVVPERDIPQDELEYLYTGKGYGEAFEFL